MFSFRNYKSHIFKYVGDTLVVIIGVTIAFQLSNWKEKSTHKALEKKFCQSFISDLENDIASLSTHYDSLSRHHQAIQNLVHVLVTQDYSNDSVFSYTKSIFAFHEFTPNDITFQALKSSGDLNLIQDFELVKSLAEHYVQGMGEIRKADDLHKEILYAQLVPYSYEHIQYANNFSFVNTEFLRDNQFVNMVFTLFYMLESKMVYYYKPALTRAHELKIKFNEYLATLK